MIVFADAVGLGMPSIILHRNLFHYYTAVTLIETGLLFLLGGLMDISSSISFRLTTDRVSKVKKGWDVKEHKQTQLTAASYIIAGLLLLAISLILAYPLN